MNMVEQLGSYGYLGLFIACFVAATLIPFSSEAVVALVIGAGYFPPAVFLVALAGNYAGSLVNYFIGKKGTDYVASRLGSKEHRRLEKAQALYGKWGAPVLLFSWVPIIGDPLTLAAGVLDIKFLPFSLWVLIGKGLRYAAIIWLVQQF